MKDCDRYQEMISSLMDGELSLHEQAELHEHMETCPECAMLFRAFTAVSVAVTAELHHTTELPSAVHDNIMAQVRREEIRKKNSLPPAIVAILSAAAVFVLVFSATLSLGNWFRDSGTSASIRGAMSSSEAVAQEGQALAQQSRINLASRFDLFTLEDFLGGEARSCSFGEPDYDLILSDGQVGLYLKEEGLFYRGGDGVTIYRAGRTAEELKALIGDFEAMPQK